MSFQAKRATWSVALGLLGLAFAPAVTHAAHPDTDRLNIGDLVAPAGESDNVTIIPTNLVPNFAAVTAPKISGVELFSNQAVFSFAGAAYSENAPVSAFHSNADEAEFWAPTISTTGTMNLGTAAIDQMLTTDNAVAHLNSVNSAVNSDNSAPAVLNAKIASASDLPTLNDLSVAGANSKTSSISLNSSSGKGVDMVELANPQLSRDIGTTGTLAVPEPTSIALLGLSGLGLLIRRRSAR